jgi:hypothetical protein
VIVSCILSKGFQIHKFWFLFQAIEHILRNVPVWQPDKVKADISTSEVKTEPEVKTESEIGAEAIHEPEGDQVRLSFNSFDLTKVLRQGRSLLAREGSELEGEKMTGLSKSEKLAKQRRRIDEVPVVLLFLVNTVGTWVGGYKLKK